MPSHKVDQAVLDSLRRLPIFARVHERDVLRVAEIGEPVEAEPGAVLMDQGDVGTECFFVIDGSAAVYSGGQHIAAISAGSIVGEMALVGHKPRNASVVAETPMHLLAFNIVAFKKLLEEMPGTQDVVMKVLEERAAENRERNS
jgi:CRP/FNR family transcriptional regulator, cyclic AMP receptor protein